MIEALGWLEIKVTLSSMIKVPDNKINHFDYLFVLLLMFEILLDLEKFFKFEFGK